MPANGRRSSPEELLQKLQDEEEALNRGRLKIFLGYASGVGKSSRMLNEAQRRAERGQDVVVGAVQMPVAAELQNILATLEVIPLQERDEQRKAIDLSAILRRRPSICVIDGLAYDNPPNLQNANRWQDVNSLLDAGISVLSSVNIQHIAELQTQVEVITGKHVSETVPVSFIKSADEIVLVDAPAEDSREQLLQQPVYISQREQRLSKLRELALVLAADVVDHQLATYLQRHGIKHHLSTNERILICIHPRTAVKEMLFTGRAIADRFHGELIAAYVRNRQISLEYQQMLDNNLQAAREAGATVEVLEGDDFVDTILDFARERGVTQVFVGHSHRTGLWNYLRASPVAKLIRACHSIDIRVFPHG